MADNLLEVVVCECCGEPRYIGIEKRDLRKKLGQSELCAKVVVVFGMPVRNDDYVPWLFTDKKTADRFLRDEVGDVPGSFVDDFLKYYQADHPFHVRDKSYFAHS